LHWGTISGGLIIFIGLVLVGLGQRFDDEVGSFYGAVRRRVVALRSRLGRRRFRGAAQPVGQPTVPISTGTSDVDRVVARLHQGTLTDGERQHLAAALAGQPIATLTAAAPAGEADVNEAITLATVATSAVKRVGTRSVLAMRFTGVSMVILGIAVLVIGLRVQ
jgi:hypothetical protein